MVGLTLNLVYMVYISLYFEKKSFFENNIFFATPRLKIRKFLIFEQNFGKNMILGLFCHKNGNNDPNNPYIPYILLNMNCHKKMKKIAFYLSEKYSFFAI